MSDRETCVAKLTELLGTISVSNGFALNLGSPVSRELFTLESLSNSEFDTLIVEDNGDGGNEVIDMLSSDEAHVSFAVPVIGYVRKRDSDPSVTTAVNRLDQALKQVVGELANRRIAGVWVHIQALPMIGRSGSENGELGWFIRPIEINYDSQVSAGM